MRACVRACVCGKCFNCFCIFLVVMLKWFVDADVAANAIQCPRNLIDEEHVEVRPERLPDAVLDENVDVNLIRKFFTQDAWLLVMDTLMQKQSKSVYVCKHCYHDLDEAPSVVCDHCLSWHHLSCVGLKQAPKSKNWYCRCCHSHPLTQ